MNSTASAILDQDKLGTAAAAQAGWSASSESESQWLFVKLRGQPVDIPAESDATLIAHIQQLLVQHGASNVVLEMDDLACLESRLIAQLVQLHTQIHQQGGLMRLSGLESRHERVLRSAGLEDRFSRYVRRERSSPSATPRKPR